MAFNYFREISNLTIDQFGACPHCGKSIAVEREDGILLQNWDGEIGNIWSIECDECDTSLGPFMSPSHAYLVWNQRIIK